MSEDFQRNLSNLAAIFLAPSLVAAIYGANTLKAATGVSNLPRFVNSAGENTTVSAPAPVSSTRSPVPLTEPSTPALLVPCAWKPLKPPSRPRLRPFTGLPTASTGNDDGRSDPGGGLLLPARG